MSAYKLVKCSIKDQDLLIKALEDLGFSPKVFETAQSLRGYLNDERDQQAEIIVPKEQLNKMFTKASNDLGFIWNDETEQFDMICSEYDVKLNIPARIKQSYAKSVIEKALEAQYFSVESTETAEMQNRKNIVKVRVVGQKYI
jgi:ABC-type uncharacterized transport system YnjBCD ATPase subunit